MRYWVKAIGLLLIFSISILVLVFNALFGQYNLNLPTMVGGIQLVQTPLNSLLSVIPSTLIAANRFRLSLAMQEPKRRITNYLAPSLPIFFLLELCLVNSLGFFASEANQNFFIQVVFISTFIEIGVWLSPKFGVYTGVALFTLAQLFYYGGLNRLIVKSDFSMSIEFLILASLTLAIVQVRKFLFQDLGFFREFKNSKIAFARRK